MNISIIGSIFFIIVIGLILLFCVYLISFLKKLFRNSSHKASTLHNIEQIQQENNKLLKELIQALKEEKTSKL